MGARGEQTLRIGMRGVAGDVAAGAALDDAPAIHHGDPVGDLDGDADIVRHEDDGEAELALELAQQQRKSASSTYFSWIFWRIAVCSFGSKVMRT